MVFGCSDGEFLIPFLSLPYFWNERLTDFFPSSAASSSLLDGAIDVDTLVLQKTGYGVIVGSR